MKKIHTMLFSMLFLAIGLNAQLRKVPAEVTNAFSAAYPTSTNLTWKDNITNFEAQFDLGGDHTEAKFNKKGEWIETVRDMKFDNLSAAVKDGFNKSKYNDWPRGEIKEQSAKGKDTLYRITVNKSDIQKKYLFFNAKGQLIRDSITL